MGKASQEDSGDVSEGAALAGAIDFSAWKLLISPTMAELEAAAKAGSLQALLALEMREDADMTDSVHVAATDYAETRAAEMVGMRKLGNTLIQNPDARWAITETTRDQLRSEITDALKEGPTPAQLAKVVRTSQAFSPQRARMIARTEIVTAHNKGTLAAYKASGVVARKRWMPDDDPCDICQANADAGAVGLDDLFPSGDDAPTAHPHCECTLSPEVDE